MQLGGFVESLGRVLPALQEAFRTGGGVPFGDYGVQHAQAALNRPGYTHQLVQEWLPQVPDLDARLRAGATVAEFGCGEGWAAIALAVGYPDVRSTGSTPIPRRSTRRAGTPRKPGWPIGCGSPWPT